jgi:uncharacterized protein (TIGR02265 family)
LPSKTQRPENPLELGRKMGCNITQTNKGFIVRPLPARPLSARLTSKTLRCFSQVKRLDSAETWETLRARIDETPPDTMIRGMFFRTLMKSAPNVASARYVPFSLYPVREYMELVLQTARSRWPEENPATAVLRAGGGVYSLFASSLAGSVIFSVADVDFRRVVELSPKAYGVTLRPGEIEVLSVADNEAVLRMRNVWPFPDIFHAGIWLGAMDSFNVTGEIEITRQSLCDVDYKLTWNRNG